MPDPFKMKRVPRLTVDAWVRDRAGRLLLVQRGKPPFEGRWGLPGGFCEYKEKTETACAREAKEETGMTVKVGKVLGVYSDPRRDPRGHTVSVLYAAKPIRGKAKGADDAAAARWFAPKELERLSFAFDHAKVIREQLGRPRRRRRAGTPRRGKRGGARG